jgi:hypothetical protein
MRGTLRLVGAIVLALLVAVLVVAVTTTLIGRSIFSDAPAPTPVRVTSEEPP